MKAELILKSDFLDILFENKNKFYGAYNLRKYYNNRLLKAMGVMLAIVIIFSAFGLMPGKKAIVDIPVFKTTPLEYVKTKDPIKIPEKIIPPEVPKQQHVAAQAFNRPEIVKFTEVKPIKELVDSSLIASKADKGDLNQNHDIIIPPNLNGNGTGDKKNEIVKPAVDKNVAVETADIMPSYPGGNAALVKFLQKNLTNPRDLDEGEAISVKIKFVVGYDGKLKGFETVEDGGREFNNEVLRVLKKMPEWIPGKSKGENVSVYYVLPVKFISNN